MQDRLLDRHWHSFWTWLAVLPLLLVLLLMWLAGYGPGRDDFGGRTAATPPLQAAASAPGAGHPVPFHFTATHDGVFAEGEPGHLPAWWAQRERLATLLAQGNELQLAGSASHVTLVGEVASAAQREAIGKDLQTLLGPDITLDNQLVVASAASAAAPSSSAQPPAAAATPPTATLYFASASSELPADAGQALETIVQYLNTHPDAHVAVSGFHDASGNAELNARLAKRRAAAVRARLLLDGIGMERIDLRKPQRTAGGGDPAKARRVELHIVPR